MNGFVVCENFAMLYGCSPDMGVLAKTTMINDVADIFLNDYNRVTLSLLIPSCFDDLKGSDASFELVASNTL